MTMRQKPASRESRFDRGAWLHLILILMLLAIALGSAIYRFTLPTDGWLAAGPNDFNTIGLIYEKNIMGAASSLQPGDHVIAVAGISLSTGLTPPTWAAKDAWQAGNTVQYTVLRGGQELQIAIPLVKWDLLSFLKNTFTASKLTAWLGLFVFLAMGFLAFWQRPAEPAARALWVLSAVWFSIATTLDILPEMMPDKIDPLASLSTSFLIIATFTILAPPAFIRFALVFPRPKPILQRRPWIAYLPYAVGLVGVGAFLVEFYVFGYAWTGLSVLIAIVILIHNAATMRDAVSRAQLRWGLGGTIAGLGLFFSTYIVYAGLTGPIVDFLYALAPFGFGIMGIALGIAVLRYRLWDIDVIIRRTLVYAILTSSLALVYFGLVILLEGLLRSLVGNGGQIATVISTLAIAALFTPLRRRVQDFIDRRFYRRKYNAEQALAEFAATARAETDLEALSAQVVVIVQNTMQPEQASLWLRENQQ